MTSQRKVDRAARLRAAIRLKQAKAKSQPPALPRRPDDHPARLGELQRSLWFMQRLQPTSAAYHLVSAYRLSGPLQVEAMRRSLNHLLHRHHLLRSTFRQSADDILQVVGPAPDWDDDSLPWRTLEVADGELIEVARRQARRPFDLASGPLLRLLYLESTSGDERLLLLVVHHILADARSLGVLWGELTERYAVYRKETGDAATEAAGEPPPQYSDYVYALEGRDPARRNADLEFWRRRLDPLPDELRLPFETAESSAPRAPTEPQPVPEGRWLQRSVTPDLRRRIRSVAATVGTRPFVIYGFLFRLLLQRMTEGRPVAFATPVSRRSHAATASMIGYFLNPVTLHTTIDEDQTVDDGLRQFARHVQEATDHGSLPFDRLVEHLAPPRRRDRHPIFQTMFVYQETLPPPTLDGMHLEPVHIDLGESKFDLTFFVHETAGTEDLALAVEFRGDRFDDVWMEQLLDGYTTLAQQLVARPQAPAAALDMVDVDARQTLGRWARGPEDPDAEGLPWLPVQILRRTRQSPDAPAVVCGDAVWSYGRLAEVARRIADELTRRGVSVGGRVGLFIDRSPWMVAGLLGCHWAGAAYVPLDPAYPSQRTRWVLEDAEVRLVLTRRAVRDRLTATPDQETPDQETPDQETPWLDIDTLASNTDQDTAQDAAQDVAQATDLDLPGLRSLSGDHPAYLLYTSGSTGRPKGVEITHHNLRLSNGARRRVYDESPERFLLLSSVAFDSSVVGIFWTLADGGTLVLPDDRTIKDPRELASLITARSVTCLLCVPSLYGHLLQHHEGRHLASLRTVIVAGESCPPQLVEEHFRALPSCRLYNEYGPTEATVWASVHEMKADEHPSTVPIGRPIPGVTLEVLDSHGRPVPAGIPGQGWISGPTLARGYWRRPDLTEERFVQTAMAADAAVPSGAAKDAGEGPSEAACPGIPRRYRTGDRLAWNRDGRLLFLGRVDDQLKLRGFRIEPGDIESLLREHEAIDDAAVVVRSGEQLVAFVTPATARDADPLPALAARLPAYMVPSRIVPLPRLPLLPNGKVDRGRLQDLPMPETAPKSAVGSQRRDNVLDPRRRALISLWQGLLGRTDITVDDHFFQLGGHSLLAVELATVIRRDFGVPLTPNDIFQHPTLNDLARRMDEHTGDATAVYDHLFPLQPGGPKAPLIFSLPHFFSHLFASRFRGERPVYGLRGVSLRPEGNRGRWPTLRHLAEDLVDEVTRRFGERPVVMAGYSFGASMAVEAVRVMEERSITVQRLILIAPMPLDVYRLGPLTFQLSGLRQPAAELSPTEAVGRFLKGYSPWRRSAYERARHGLITVPRRWLLCQLGRLREMTGRPLSANILHADVRLERFRLHRQYRPGPVHSPTVIFNATEPEADAAATWRPYFQGPLTVHPTPDPHLGAAAVEAASEIIMGHLDDLGDP